MSDVTQKRMAMVFDEWARRYAKDPDSFGEVLDSEGKPATGGRGMTKHYAERDIMALDKQGEYYSRHVSAMTAEELHSKSAIAAELAWRDSLIDALNWEVAASRLFIHQIKEIMACNDPGNYEMIFGEPPK